MNTISKLFIGVAALSLAACSNDEPAQGGNDQNTVKGDVAYLNIKITSADDVVGSRSTTGSINNEEYIYGDEGENDVVSAHFYFYDGEGRYMMTANRWTGGDTGTTENVEYIGDNTVVLENLTGKDYPVWMVTVLNQPADRSYENLSLDQLKNELLDSWDSGKSNGRFVMTTSSYFGDDNKSENGWNYFATKLSSNNFYQQTPDKVDFKDEDRVDVYVERLAVRVGVDMSKLSNEKSSYTYKENGKEYDLYRIDASVAGSDNPSVDGELPAAATKLYVAVTGWELTSTAKRTNLMKNLEDWTDATSFGDPAWLTQGGNWNHADYHRSYWGKSYTYNEKDNALAAKLNVADQTWESLSQVVGTKIFNGTRVYCNENTNVPENLTKGGQASDALVPNKTTTVLLRAVVCDEKGNPMQLVNYLGLNFTKESFINRVLAVSNTGYYTRTKVGEWANGSDKFEYTEIGADDVKLVKGGQGTGSVQVAVNEENTYYAITGTVDKEYKYTDEDNVEHIITWTEQEATEVTPATVNAKLATATNGASNKAVAYTDGAMYYPVPVAHLHQPASETADLIEGQYGVVRNHVYNVSISKIKTLGEGVFVPKKVNGDEAEELNPDEPKNPTYYVESTINILSWKVVSQDVEI